MRACHCTLGGTAACRNCPNNQHPWGVYPYYSPQPYYPPLPIQPEPPAIDYDELVKRIVDEMERRKK